MSAPPGNPAPQMAWRRAAALVAAVVTLAFVSAQHPAHATTFTGYIEVNNATTFIGDTFNSFGEYTTTSSLADALAVSFDPSSSPFSITVTNNPASSSYPYLGGIQGYGSTNANLGSGSYNYSFLGGTVATSPGATPATDGNSFTAATSISEAIESAIWSISSGDALTAQWINTDGSSPTTYVVTATGGGNEVVLTGDPTTFGSAFDGETTDTLIFVCTAAGGCPLSASGSVPEPSGWLVLLAPLAWLGAIRVRAAARSSRVS